MLGETSKGETSRNVKQVEIVVRGTRSRPGSMKVGYAYLVLLETEDGEPRRVNAPTTFTYIRRITYYAGSRRFGAHRAHSRTEN